MYSQGNQDVNVIEFYNRKTRGYYVDVGAYDGYKKSNTFLLNGHFGWKGVCVEANPATYDKLVTMRPNAICVNAFIHDESDRDVKFDIYEDDYMCGINDEICLKRSDKSAGYKQTVDLKTLSLMDLLRGCRSPVFIEYLSLNVDGIEADILDKFDFTKYEFGLIDVANYDTKKRWVVRSLLERNGYVFLRDNKGICDSYKHHSL